MTALAPSPRVALVVDDDPDLALLCTLHLQAAGYQVIETHTGAEALRVARATPPSVVVLDRTLTDCDGLEVLAQLRQDARTAHVPVVMVSARALEQDRVDARTGGADDYVVKPFDAEELVAAVDGALERPHLPLDTVGGATSDAAPGTASGTASDTADLVAALRAELADLHESEQRRTEHLRRLSHELRTPLTAIKGFSEWLALNWERTPDDRKRDLLDRVVDAGGRLEHLVQGLLDFARLERGDLHGDVAPHRLSAILEATLQQLSPALDGHDVDVRLEEDATVLVDLEAAVRVIEDLLSTAARSSPPGATVHVTAHPAPVRVPVGRTGDHDEAVLLSVHDGGEGSDLTLRLRTLPGQR